MQLRRSKDKMHRVETGKSSDWDGLSYEQMNNWQKVASKTRGILSLGNTITIAGTLLVLDGLNSFANGNKLQGTIEVGVGRGLDLVDGYAANKTGTKSDLGADADAAADTIQITTGLVVAVNEGFMPVTAAAIVGAPKALNIFSSISAKFRSKDIKVSGEGKLGTALVWGGFGAFMLDSALGSCSSEIVSTTLQATGWTCAIGGTVVSLPATKEYAQIGLGNRTEQEL